MSQVKLISECYIKPINSDDEKYRLPYYLGPGDVAMLSIGYIQRGLLFANTSNANTTLSDVLERLKSSLSLVLVHFYPLAGQLSTELYEAEHSCWIYIDCNKGPGARLISASALDLTVSEIVLGSSSDGDVPNIVGSFFDLGEDVVSYDGHTRPLLSIQVTELADGVFIGYSMNHSVGDGTSLTQFLNAWSEIFMKSSNSLYDGKISNVPIFKPPFPDGYGPIIKLPYLKPEEFISRYEDASDKRRLRKRTFHFSATSIAMLKAKANAKNSGVGGHGGSNLGGKQLNIISSFQALSALVWQSITKARNLPLDEDTICVLAVNLRPRLDPPLSNEYFGNFMDAANVNSKVDELLNYDLGSAAMLLHHAITSKDDIAARNVFLQPFVKSGPQVNRPRFSLGGKNVVMSGSPRFEAYQPEFGLGKAVAIRYGFSITFDGSVTALQGHEGGGSVDLQIRLAPETMDRLLSDQEFMSFVSTPSSRF